VSYFDFAGGGLGFNTVKGICVTAFDPMTEKDKEKIDRAVGKLSRRFYNGLMQPAYPAPTLLSFLPSGWPEPAWGCCSMTAAATTRTTGKRLVQIRVLLPCPPKPLKKAAGNLFDSIAAISSRKRMETPTPAQK